MKGRLIVLAALVAANVALVKPARAADGVCTTQWCLCDWFCSGLEQCVQGCGDSPFPFTSCGGDCGGGPPPQCCP